MTESGSERAVFVIVGDADPQTVPRIVLTLALVNVTPTSLVCVRTSPDRLELSAVYEPVDAGAMHYVHRKLQQLTCVSRASWELR